MTLEDIRKLNDAAPFRPYEIHRADGKVAKVAHPDFIAFSPTGRSVAVYAENGVMETIAVSHIVALHRTPAEEATSL